MISIPLYRSLSGQMSNLIERLNLSLQKSAGDTDSLRARLHDIQHQQCNSSVFQEEEEKVSRDQALRAQQYQCQL